MVIHKAKRAVPRRVKRTFRALRHRNYRLWFFGQMFSLFGTWMQLTAQGFLIYELTRSPGYLGLVGFAGGIPALLLTTYGGVVADRFPRKNILLATQVAMMVLAFILAGLTITGAITPLEILILAFLLGIANAFDAPARQAMTYELVPREDLSNAISLNGTMVNLALVAGPGLAGIIYALSGPSTCFIINGISFIAVILALLVMNIQSQIKPKIRTSTIYELREGFRYTLSHGAVFANLLVVSLMSILGIAFMTLIPAWAVNVLGGNSETNGILQSARGVGALAVALWTASLEGVSSRGKLIALGTFATPFLLVAFAYARSLETAAILIALTGGATLLVVNMTMGLIHHLSSDNFRGRVMGIYSLAFFGLQPIGSLWIGVFAEYFGEQSAIIASALLLLALSLILWRFSSEIRKIE